MIKRMVAFCMPPSLAWAHAGHGEGAHFSFHLNVLLVAGFAAAVGSFLLRNRVVRKPVRIRRP